MAKVTMTFEDTGRGTVRIVSDPNFETMMKMEVSGQGLTSAHGYAIAAMNALRKKSKEVKDSGIIIPKLVS